MASEIPGMMRQLFCKVTIDTVLYDCLLYTSHPLPDGSCVPLFSDVLTLVGGRVPLIVEVKHHGGAARNAASALQQLGAYGGPYCVESFHPVSYTHLAMLKAVTQLVMPGVVAEDEAEVAGHLADMGLDTPRATAQVRYQDGTEMTLELGGDVPTTSYSYFRWSGDDGVYMCDSGLTDALLTTATRLLPVEDVYKRQVYHKIAGLEKGFLRPELFVAFQTRCV